MDQSPSLFKKLLSLVAQELLPPNRTSDEAENLAPDDPGLVDTSMGATTAPQFWGGTALALIEKWPEWIHRRVETVQFVGRHRVIRRVSLDLELPTDISALVERKAPPSWLERTLIPLTFLDKELLAGFSLKGPDGQPLPVATMMQNAEVSWNALVLVGEVAAGRPLSDPTRDALWETVSGSDGEKARKQFDKLLAATGPGSIAADVAQMRRRAQEFGRFQWLGQEVSANFVLYTQVPLKLLNARTVLKFEFDEVLDPPHLMGSKVRSDLTRSEKIKAALGWEPTGMEFEVPATGDQISYHFEAEPPDGLIFDKDSSMVSIRDGDGEVREARKIVTPGRAHFHMPPLVQKHNSKVRLRVIPPRDGGLLRTTRWVGLVVTAILLVGMVGTNTIATFSSNADAVAALLLAIPGFMVAHFVRPSEHVFSSEILRGIRALILGLAGALYFAAWSVLAGGVLNKTTIWTLEVLGTTWNMSLLRLGWLALFGVAVAATVVLWRAGKPSERATEPDRPAWVAVKPF